MPPSVQLAFPVHHLSCCSFLFLFCLFLHAGILSLVRNFSGLTWVRVQQLQEQCCPFLPVSVCVSVQYFCVSKTPSLPVSVCVCVCACVCSVFACPKLQACQWLGFLPCMQVLCIWLLTQLQKLYGYCNSKGVYTASWLEETNWVGHASALYIKPFCQSGSAWFSSVLNVIGVTVSIPQFF